jgi:peptidoglycan/xylan/chitin deacetylase (PgdA/CDA1 family)
MQLAAQEKWVTFFHAHIPGTSVSRGALERFFTLADTYGLDYVRFDELVPGPPHAGVALCFDDNAPEAWQSVQDILDAHHARVTYFVSRWNNLTDDEHAIIHALNDAGHDVEPHSVNHIHANDYVAQHGLDAYVNDEVLPEMMWLNEAGFPSTSYAYPFGEHSDAIDQALFPYFQRLRVSPGGCPY